MHDVDLYCDGTAIHAMQPNDSRPEYRATEMARDAEHPKGAIESVGSGTPLPTPPIETYVERSIVPVLLRAAAEFPAVVLTGPRQSGKTTLLRHLFGSTCRYVSLDAPDIRAAALHDPRGFLEVHPAPVIIDEVQHAPTLLPYVKERIDADRCATGQYLLVSSQNLSISESVSESLAGRAATLRLLPLSNRELRHEPQMALPWEDGSSPVQDPSRSFGAIWKDFLRGGYPEVATQPGRDAWLWHSSYVQTYLERDVRTLRQVGDLSRYQDFLQTLVARTAQLLNLSDIARELGVAVNTVKAWLSVLEATYQVVVVRPYFANLGKRLVKMPKVYFTDVGTLCYLAGLKDPDHAAAGPMGGPIMEAAVLAEIRRTLTHSGTEPRVYFWRAMAGSEVDFVVDTGERLIPIEVKLSGTPRPAMGNAIRRFRSDIGSKAGDGYVVHPGSMRLPLGSNVTALPFGAL